MLQVGGGMSLHQAAASIHQAATTTTTTNSSGGNSNSDSEDSMVDYNRSPNPPTTPNHLTAAAAPRSPRSPAGSGSGPALPTSSTKPEERDPPSTNGRLLWDFLQQLLNDPGQIYTSYIQWKNKVNVWGNSKKVSKSKKGANQKGSKSKKRAIAKKAIAKGEE